MQPRYLPLLICSLTFLFSSTVACQAAPLDDYVAGFIYQERKDMKISTRSAACQTSSNDSLWSATADGTLAQMCF
jgi:hypothetical protein